jgi:hypothetical protein
MRSILEEVAVKDLLVKYVNTCVRIVINSVLQFDVCQLAKTNCFSAGVQFYLHRIIVLEGDVYLNARIFRRLCKSQPRTSEIVSEISV